MSVCHWKNGGIKPSLQMNLGTAGYDAAVRMEKADPEVMNKVS